MRTLLRQAIAQALAALRDEGWTLDPLAVIPVERPKRPEHGDLASNVALALAKSSGRRPRDLAEALAERLRRDAAGVVRSVEVAGPGFLNVRLTDAAVHAVLQQVFDQGARYGHTQPAAGAPKVLLEFVSANPTGPLHLGHGRGAVVGDALARVLRAAGEDVSTEYYVNDAGSQVQKLAASVRAALDGAPAPEGGYAGAYVGDLARELTDEGLSAATDEALSVAAVAKMLAGIERTLDRLGVRFDRFASERALVQGGAVALGLADLEARGLTETRDGALFFRSSALGEDDKDRVLRKRNGELTYFATDVAYHRDKLLRGYERLIDVWGADHHGYVARVRAGLEALGLPAERFEVLLLQLVKLLKDGKEVKFSKRAGNFVTVDEVLDEVDAATGHEGSGRDAVRFLFLLRSHDSPLEFDLDVARTQSVENPVFYAQMTHARMCSIEERALQSEDFAEARRRGVLNIPQGFDGRLAEKLTLPEERDILATCDAFPDLVREAAAARAPHRVAFWVLELAQAFASYFTRMQRVHGEPVLPQRSFREASADWMDRWDWDKTRARLSWLRAVRQVYANALALLGVEAPTRMERAETPEA